MSNGTAALQLVASEPPSASPRPPGKPDAVPTELELKIGRAVADAAILLCAAVLDYHETGRVPADYTLLFRANYLSFAANRGVAGPRSCRP